MPWYNKGKFSVMGGSVILLTDTLKLMLVGASAPFDPDHNFVSDLVSHEVSGTGYAGGFGGSGRKALTSRTLTEDDSNDRVTFTATNVTWTSINVGVVAAAILFKEVSSDSDSPVLVFVDFPNLTTGGGDLTLQWDPGGMLSFS